MHHSQRAAGLRQVSPEHLELLVQHFPGSPEEPLATPFAAVLSFCLGARSGWKRVCRRLTSRVGVVQTAPMDSLRSPGAVGVGQRSPRTAALAARSPDLRSAGFVQLPSVIWIPVCHFLMRFTSEHGADHAEDGLLVREETSNLCCCQPARTVPSHRQVPPLMASRERRG